MAWMITKDNLTRKGEVGHAGGMGQWGKEGDPEGQNKQPSTGTLPIRFKLYDDDGNLYYHGRCDAASMSYEGFAYERWGGLYQALRWAEGWAGAVDLRVEADAYIAATYPDYGISDSITEHVDKYIKPYIKDGWYSPYG